MVAAAAETELATRLHLEYHSTKTCEGIMQNFVASNSDEQSWREMK